MEITQEKKKEIEKAIVDKSITALEQGFIKEDDLGIIAKFTLDKIDTLKTQDDLIVFLRELSNKWHFFSDMLVIESGEIQKNNERMVIEQIQGLTDNGNLDEAIKIAKQATEAPQT